MRFDKNVGRRLAELGLKVVAIGWRLLQGGVRDLRLFGGIWGRLKKVGDEEDLQDTEGGEEQKEEASSSHDALHPGDCVTFCGVQRSSQFLSFQTPRGRSTKTHNLFTRCDVKHFHIFQCFHSADAKMLQAALSLILAASLPSFPHLSQLPLRRTLKTKT